MARILKFCLGNYCLGLLAVGLAACGSPASEDDGGAGSGSESESTTAAETETGNAETGETETETETGDADGDPARPARLAVTADWRSKRLSLLDYAALRDLEALSGGAQTREAVLWKTIELPEYEPGPLEVELTPDGNLAVVAVSPGFFGGTAGALVGLAAGQVPEGGTLLIIEIDSGTILAELETAQYPMGIAISPDGTKAWTANYGGNGQSGTTLSTIDLVNFTITAEYEIGPGPEQLDLSADGSLGIINTASDGSIRLFSTADPSASLSPSLEVSGDPSWVLLLEDASDRAVSINSLGPPGYSLLDVSDPAAPTVLDTIEVSGIAYAAAPGIVSNEILLSIYAGTSTSLQMFDVDTGEVIEVIDVPSPGFPLGIVFEPNDQIALVPAPGSNTLIIADFISGEYRVLDWQDEVGPTYVTLE